MFIHPADTNEVEMSLLINMFLYSQNTLINIQDTTGSDMCKKWMRKPLIHILPSDCSLNTSEIYACPSIKYLNCANNPIMLGKILMGVLSFGYLNSAVMWWLAGNHFKAMKEGKGYSIIKGFQENPTYNY